MDNKCKSCGKELCNHGRLHVHDGKVECMDCGEISDRYPPIKYALPFYEDEVSWNSDIYFLVCEDCYAKYTHWKPKTQILDFKEVEKLWWSGEGMIKNPINRVSQDKKGD